VNDERRVLRGQTCALDQNQRQGSIIAKVSKEKSDCLDPKPQSVPIREAQYAHFTGNRFRHGSRFLRWPPNKAPTSCSMEQVKPRVQNLEDRLERGWQKNE
jgi:hypothetical protein